MIAAQQKLDNLYVIVDSNHSSDRAVDMSCLSSKFQDFGFWTEMIDGHNHEHISVSLQRCYGCRPFAIIAETIKGYGVARMRTPEWHHKAPTKDELEEILAELS